MPTYYNHILYPRDEHSPTMHDDLETNGTFYALRSLVLAGPEDVIQIDPKLRAHAEFMREHLATAGVETPKNIEWSRDREVAREYEDHDLDVYIWDKGWNDIRPNKRRLKATRTVGDKNNFIRHFVELGFQEYMPNTLVVEPDGAFGKRGRWPALVKPPDASNGTDQHRVASAQELRRAASRVGPRYQVQQLIPDIRTNTSKNYFARNGVAEPQILTKTHVNKKGEHVGNSYRPIARHDPGEATDPFATEAARLGLEGWFGIDSVIDRSGRIFNLECNARITWVIYPMILARRLGLDATQEWSAYVRSTRLTDPRAIKLGALAFNHPDNQSSQEGVVLISTSQMELVKSGEKPKVEALFVGSADRQRELRRELDQVLNQRWKPDQAKQRRKTTPAAKIAA